MLYNLYCAACQSFGFTYLATTGGCYKVVNENLNWDNAGQQCRSLHNDAHLLVINDATEQSAVSEMLDAIESQCQFYLR